MKNLHLQGNHHACADGAAGGGGGCVHVMESTGVGPVAHPYSEGGYKNKKVGGEDLGPELGEKNPQGSDLSVIKNPLRPLLGWLETG